MAREQALKQRQEATRQQPARKRGQRTTHKLSSTSISDPNVPSSSSHEGVTSVSDDRPPTRKKQKTQTEQVTSNECAFCFGVYCSDGEDWIQRACGTWLHEDCVEEIFTDATGQERFCPSCTAVTS